MKVRAPTASKSRGRATIVRPSRKTFSSVKRQAASASRRKNSGTSGGGGSANGTTSHQEIRRWAEARGGKPAMVIRGSKGRKPEGVLRIEFQGGRYSEALTPISWDEWFMLFDEKRLAFVKQESKSNRFNKLVSRD